MKRFIGLSAFLLTGLAFAQFAAPTAKEELHRHLFENLDVISTSCEGLPIPENAENECFAVTDEDENSEYPDSVWAELAVNAMQSYRTLTRKKHDTHMYYWTDFDWTKFYEDDPSHLPYLKVKVYYQNQVEFHFTLVYYYKLGNRVALVHTE